MYEGMCGTRGFKNAPLYCLYRGTIGFANYGIRASCNSSSLRLTFSEPEIVHRGERQRRLLYTERWGLRDVTERSSALRMLGRHFDLTMLRRTQASATLAKSFESTGVSNDHCQGCIHAHI